MTERNNPTFYRGQRESTSVIDLQNEFNRLDDSITQRSTISILSETWMNHEEDVDVQNVHCIAKFKTPDCRAAGVAIFKYNRDTSTIVTSQKDVAFCNKIIIHLPMILSGDFNNEVFTFAVWS